MPASQKSKFGKRFGAVVRSYIIKAYFCSCQSRRGLLLYQHHLVTGTTLQQTLLQHYQFRVFWFGQCLWTKWMECWIQQPSVWKVGIECSEMGEFSVAKHFDEPTGFSYDLLNGGTYRITAKNSQTQSSRDDNDWGTRWWQQTINQWFQQARSRNWSWRKWFWQKKQAFQAMRGVMMYINN